MVLHLHVIFIRFVWLTKTNDFLFAALRQLFFLNDHRLCVPIPCSIIPMWYRTKKSTKLMIVRRRHHLINNFFFGWHRYRYIYNKLMVSYNDCCGRWYFWLNKSLPSLDILDNIKWNFRNFACITKRLFEFELKNDLIKLSNFHWEIFFWNSIHTAAASHCFDMHVRPKYLIRITNNCLNSSVFQNGMRIGDLWLNRISGTKQCYNLIWS